MIVRLPSSQVAVEVEFNPDEVRARYDAERAKRASRERGSQFRGMADVWGSDGADPWASPLERDPVNEVLDVMVIGGGFGGLLAGAYLSRNDIDTFRIVEQGGDFGGVWYWNRYPGVQCDVESFVYLPLLEETCFIPSKRYADGSEILDHARRIGRQYDLYSKALFQTNVTSVEWQDNEERWRIKTDRGDSIHARFVIRANGPLNKPQIPSVSGINEFSGRIFHTSRWDYDCTGGSAAGKLDRLRDKRVAIVGTGATGIQAMPYLARDAKELFVIQRTPSAVGPRNNRPTDSEWAKNLRPGWQSERHHNFNSIVNGHHQARNLVDDAWTDAIPALSGQKLINVPVSSLSVEDQRALGEIADMQLMQAVHQHIDATVSDPSTAEELKPWFGYLCKRPNFNDEYLEAFNSPSVRLVYNPSGIDRLTSTGVVVGGKEYEVDVIIFATGFETGGPPTSRDGYDVSGREGLSMRHQFADGSKTFHGFFAHGFPNFVELGLSQNPYVVNYTYMLDRKARHAARVIGHAIANRIGVIEPELESQKGWGQATWRSSAERRAYLASCTPGYFNGRGDLGQSYFNDVHQGSEIKFWEMIEDWWEEGSFAGMSLE